MRSNPEDNLLHHLSSIKISVSGQNTIPHRAVNLITRAMKPSSAMQTSNCLIFPAIKVESACGERTLKGLGVTKGGQELTPHPDTGVGCVGGAPGGNLAQ